MATRKKKSSLVDNINCRKKAGTSRPKSRSKVSAESYEQMEEGWPKKRAKKKSAKKKSAKKKASKKRARRSKR